MNLNNVASFVDDNLTTIKCKFNASKTDELYTFKVTKEFAATLSKDDLVVAEVKDFYSIVHVVEIDEVSDIDVNKPFKYNWAFTKVDLTMLKMLNDKENTNIKSLKTKQRQALKAQVMSALLESTNQDLLEAKES